MYPYKTFFNLYCYPVALGRLFIAHRRKNAKSYNKQKNPCNLLSYTDFYLSIAYRFFT